MKFQTFSSVKSFINYSNHINYIINSISIFQVSLLERHKIPISHFGFYHPHPLAFSDLKPLFCQLWTELCPPKSMD